MEEPVQAIFDMFAFLNSAIDGGAMTQKAFSIAVLGLSCRIYTGWREGAIPSERLPQFSRELEQLDGHWRAHREAANRPRVVQAAAPAAQPVQIQIVSRATEVTPAMTRAGVAAIEKSHGVDTEELVTRVYRAMAEAA
jgi:hypothetical protein